MSRPNRYRAGPLPGVFLGAALLLAGCPDESLTDGGVAGQPDLSAPDMAMVDGATPDLLSGAPSVSPSTTGGAFSHPFDSTPDSTGQNFYFVARGAKGPGVWKSPAAGGAAVEVVAGAPFISPFGITISDDDKTLLVADRSAGDDPNDPMGDSPGAIVTVPSSGGGAALLMGTRGYAPCAVEVRGADAFFTGRDPQGAAGLFRIPVAGGAVTPVAKGDPFASPCGVAIAKSGDAYVAETIGGPGGSGRVVKVTGGAASVFIDALPMGFPAGIALTADERTLLVSGQDRVSGMSVVYVVDVATKGVTPFNKGLEGSADSGGVHRARDANTFSWAGVTAGTQGTVFRVEFK